MGQVAKRSIGKRKSSSDRYVVPNSASGGWDIVKEGHRRATGHAQTKAGAIRSARTIVGKEGGGEIRILNRSGKIVDSNTVPSARGRRAA